MWKRDEAVRQPAAPTLDAAAAAAPAAARQATRPDPMPSQNGRDVVNIGKSVVIKGELNGSEDLTIECHEEARIVARDNTVTLDRTARVQGDIVHHTIGIEAGAYVEGKIELRDHVLTIGANGKIKAELYAKSIVVLGEVIGNVSASEKVDIRENGSVEGDITSPRVAIAEGAHFRGSVDMANKGKAASGPRPAEVKPQPAPQPVVAPQAQKVG